MREGRTESPFGLDPKTEAPFHSLLAQERWEVAGLDGREERYSRGLRVS